MRAGQGSSTQPNPDPQGVLPTWASTAFHCFVMADTRLGT